MTRTRSARHQAFVLALVLLSSCASDVFPADARDAITNPRDVVTDSDAVDAFDTVDVTPRDTAIDLVEEPPAMCAATGFCASEGVSPAPGGCCPARADLSATLNTGTSYDQVHACCDLPAACRFDVTLHITLSRGLGCDAPPGYDLTYANCSCIDHVVNCPQLADGTGGIPGCYTLGRPTITNDRWGCTNEGKPGPELCNLLDDDADDEVDEGIPDLECGIGECHRTITACVCGVTGHCVPGSPAPETCDGRDNDCDGAIDNGPSNCPTDAGTD